MGNCYGSDVVVNEAKKDEKPDPAKPETKANRDNGDRRKNPDERRRSSGAVPCGKRTDFGYDKDFGTRYIIGKLLGHGQFGYTFVATDKSNGDKVAVKRIDKNKVNLQFSLDRCTVNIN
jgi:calcium-dependent protein kinase